MEGECVGLMGPRRKKCVRGPSLGHAIAPINCAPYDGAPNHSLLAEKMLFGNREVCIKML